ncbi:putative polysaccharide transport protein [Bradyrhizobium sp. ORS 285]|uniref:lipopolysaccharide biosynthesis protein n=1 Tax=Bradyrhizobium sp. ORS 285 TaxID=115808 RepID=UPI000240894C|nr:lipopolysaccharide biosynthesis protein [Bradyrhizobium sp. ORS 285]CCD84532.1 putative polysaccharide transport protein [Bradyrhizobium sp. ORS 285]SMX57513.1 putative polysaccharide transport protein [Bradyrhizobium sp. ORS 285]
MSEAVAAYFEEHRESHDLGRRALRGGIVSIVIQYGNAVLQIVAAIVLARLLAPEDFGLVAIVTVLTSFAPLLIDFGLLDATAQRSRVTPAQVSGLFWVSAGIGMAVAVIVAACSPVIAWIYDDSRLLPISLCIAVTFVLAGLTNQHMALLRRTMQFGRIGRIQLFGTFVGTIAAIAAAMAGYGYWALVLRPVTSAICVVIGTWAACPWRPGTPVFDDEVKSMVRFGLHVVGFTVAYTLSRAVDRIALGLLYRPDQVGYYQNAMNLYDNSIYAALNQTHAVGSSALSKLQANPAALREKYEAALSMLAFFLMPAAAILSVTAEDLTVVLLGQKWQAAGALLSIIALRGISHVVEGSQGWLHLSLGRADRWQTWGIISLVAQVGAVLAGLPFGPAGVAWGVVIGYSVIALPSVMYAGRPIDIGAALVIRAVGPQTIGAVATVAAGWWLQATLLAGVPALLRMVLSGCFCACVDLAIVVGVFRHVEPLRIAGTIIQDLMRKR